MLYVSLISIEVDIHVVWDNMPQIDSVVVRAQSITQSSAVPHKRYS